MISTHFKPIFTAVFWLFLLLLSCSREEIDFAVPTQKLAFSADTVVLDTVFNQVRSETYAFKIYNREVSNIKISKIYLENRAASLYRINVDGKPGFEFENIELRSKDSLYIFVEIAPNTSTTEFVAEEKLFIETPVARQQVTLLSLVKDAEFFVSTEEKPYRISQNTTWNSQKAKIIYGKLEIDAGKTLTVEAGTEIYFHKNAALQVRGNSRLDVRGTLGKEVVFRGNRHDPRYDSLPMNWGGLRFSEGSTLQMNYAKIFGGETGISMQKSRAEIQNTVIHTFQNFGILAVESEISAKNLVMNNFGEAAIALYGGKYEFVHSTIANYWNLSPMPALGILASNQVEGNASALDFSLKNSIVYTQNINALQFNSSGSLTYFIENSLLKYDVKTAGFNWENNANIINSFKNTDPQFVNVNTAKMNLRLKAESLARGKGKVAMALLVPYDIAGTDRRILPTIGAYQ